MTSLYNNARWRRRRARQLRAEPLCRLCREVLGRIRPAQVADHIEPHHGDPALFEGPLQSLCASCHSALKRQRERSGCFKGCDARGLPLDPEHWWRKKI